MRYLNANQAAKRLGISDKTIRRWLAEGDTGKWKLKALRTSSNQLAIAESDIERIERVLEQERSLFVKADHTETLEARIKELEQEVASLKERVAILEQEKLILQGKDRAVSSGISQRSGAQKRVTKRISKIPHDLPPGTLSAADFAAKIGLEYANLKNFIKRGVSGERLDTTEVPHPSRPGQSQYFLTPDQQKATHALLAKHGKIPSEEYVP
jgi:transposase